MWRHVTEIKLVHEESGSYSFKKQIAAVEKQRIACAAMLQLLPSFASLAALTLDGITLGAGPVIELFDSISSRLLSLGLSHCSREFEFQLHRLSSLRVLVLSWIPQWDSLIQLHQLVYLHFQGDSGVPVCARLGFAIRWLSVHHQLRSLSTESIWYGDGFVPALLSCEPQSAANAARQVEFNGRVHPALDPTMPCALADLALDHMTSESKPFLGSLPSLTHLQIGWEYSPDRQFLTAELDPSLQLTLPRLQQLRMKVYHSNWYMGHLTRCTALRVVDLICCMQSMTCMALQPLLQAWSATLEECNLRVSMLLNPYTEWTGLAACQRLRTFRLRLGKGQELAEGCVAALQQLPSFHTLALSWYEVDMSPLLTNLLAVLAQSRSFSTLHLHSLSDSEQIPYFFLSRKQTRGRSLSHMLSALKSALLTRQTLARIRVIGHWKQEGVAMAQSFRIGRNASNQHAWVIED